MFLDLVHNIAILVALVAAAQMAIAKFSESQLGKQAILGLLFGAVTVLGMATPLYFAQGVIFDGRSIVLCAGAVVGGGVTAAIGAAIAAAYRLWLGGGGAAVGIATVLLSALIGVLGRWFWERRKIRPGPAHFLILGVIVQLAQFAAFTQLPEGSGYRFIREGGVYLLIFYPLATMLLCQIFADYQDNLAAQHALRLEQMLLDVATEGGRVGIWNLDPSNNRLVWNARMYKIYALDPGSSKDLYESWQSAIHSADAGRVMCQLRDALSSEKRFEMEFRIVRPSGEIRHLISRGQAIRDDPGRLERVAGVNIDVTDQKRAEEAVARERSFLRTLIDTLPDLIWLKDTQGVFLTCNKKFERLCGVPEQQITGKMDYDFVSKELADSFREYDCVAIENNGVSTNEEEVTFVSDGHRELLETTKVPMRDADGNVIGVLGIGHDITERKRAGREMSLLNFAMNNVHEAAFLIDENARCLYANDEACRQLEYDREELLKLTISDIDPNFPAGCWPSHWQDLKERRSLIFEGHHRTKSGCIIPVEISANYIEYDDTGYNLALVRDITGRRRVEAELHRYKDQLEDTVQRRTAELLLARDAAEAANKAKSVFLANMSHELRTPLNAVLGFSSLMRREPGVTVSQREKLDIINRSGEHLLTLINDVLEMAKIEAGRLQLEKAPFDLGSLVRGVADMMRLRAQEKGLTLIVDQCSSFPRFIEGDEARLRQILINLVGNAVKFTERGGVTVRLGTRQNDRQHLIMEIEDTGIGIGPEDQERLFQPFVQLTGPGEQKGTGLGLAITRQFVELMGGSIAVESTPGKGSVFRVDLPVEIAEAAAVSASAAEAPAQEVCGLVPGQPAFRILIAEDHRDSQLLLMKLMADIGVGAKLAANGEECIALFKEWHPQLIWMDRRMPAMDGVEATRRIRQLPGGREVKIVAVTASAFKEQRQELLDAGMDDFVRKPYRIGEIYGCLAKQLNLKYVYRSAAPPAEPPAKLEPAAVAKLPAGLRASLKAALESLESERVAAAIEKVRELDAELAATMARLAGEFDYTAMLQALEAAHGNMEQVP